MIESGFFFFLSPNDLKRNERRIDTSQENGIWVNGYEQVYKSVERINRFDQMSQKTDTINEKTEEKKTCERVWLWGIYMYMYMYGVSNAESKDWDCTPFTRTISHTLSLS